MEVYNNFKNAPEGYLSVIMEYTRNNCLDQLVTNVGTLPENLLIKLGWQLIRAINHFQTKTNQSYQGLFPSQILLDENDNIKVFLTTNYFTLVNIGPEANTSSKC